MNRRFTQICSLVLLLIIVSGCMETSKKQRMHFAKIPPSKNPVERTEINIQKAYNLGKDQILLIGHRNDKAEQDVGQKLFLLDASTHKIEFESDTEETPYGGCLYAVKVQDQTLVLWEKITEYASTLSLFAFYNRQFRFVGNFDVMLETAMNNTEDYSYPVEEIEVVASGPKIEFGFLRKLLLHPSQETEKKTLPSLTYEVDINTYSFKIK